MKIADGLNNDRVLAHLRRSFEDMGFEIERVKKSDQKVRRPVLFGGRGSEQRVAYELDGFHDGLGIILEVEAGRGALGNAVYRDLIRTSLVVEARFLAFGVMQEYRYKSGGRSMRYASYKDAVGILDAVYARGRLNRPSRSDRPYCVGSSTDSSWAQHRSRTRRPAGPRATD